MASNTLPLSCPSCQYRLNVVRLNCAHCATSVEGNYDLPILSRLGAEDQLFLLHFIKSSGSLKELSRVYKLSYPTVRNRLDDLISRIHEVESEMTQEETQ